MSHISPAEKDRIMDVVEEWIVGDEDGHQEQAKIYQVSFCAICHLAQFNSFFGGRV